MVQYIQSFILNRQIVTNISFISRPVSNKLTSYHIYTYVHISTYILDSQALRVSRICLSEKDFKAHICRMKEKSLINYRETKLFSMKTHLLRNPQKLEFLLWLHINRKLKILANWLKIYPHCFKVIKKLRSFHLPL